jgi:hypothetical protein
MLISRLAERIPKSIRDSKELLELMAWSFFLLGGIWFFFRKAQLPLGISDVIPAIAFGLVAGFIVLALVYPMSLSLFQVRRIMSVPLWANFLFLFGETLFLSRDIGNIEGILSDLYELQVNNSKFFYLTLICSVSFFAFSGVVVLCASAYLYVSKKLMES